MTPNEFNRWWADLTVRFPNVESWLLRVAPDAIAQRTVLRTWHDVLRDVAVEPALDVNRNMQAGDAEFVADFHEQDIPSHVRRLTRQLTYERRERPADEPTGKLTPSSFPAGKILHRILELTDRGISSEEAKAIVLKELPVGRPNYEPRYHCSICFDVGMVTVASQRAIQYLLADRLHECHHREAAMLCSCKGHIAQNPRRPHLVYDSTKDFKIEDYSWRPAEVDRFRAWVEAKRDEYWNSKRESDFDRFNQREFA
jgi:hypothetical protein